MIEANADWEQSVSRQQRRCRRQQAGGGALRRAAEESRGEDTRDRIFGSTAVTAPVGDEPSKERRNSWSGGGRMRREWVSETQGGQSVMEGW